MEARGVRGRVIALTGASGYVGGRIVEAALARGDTILALGRRPLRRAGVRDLPFDLKTPGMPTLPQDPVALIHAAADTTGAGHLTEAEQLEALRVLADGAPSARLIFVSSQSAAQDAPSEYGRTKWRLEEEVARRGGVSVRPGLVLGGPERGLYGRLLTLVRALPVLPRLVGPRPVAQPIHVDDLAAALMRLVDAPHAPGGILRLGAPEPIPFDRVLRALARREGRRRLFLPVPLGLVHAVLRLVERVTGRVAGAASLRSLARTRPMRAQDDLKRLGLALRPIGPRRPTPRRILLQEGSLLLGYLHRGPAPRGCVARYARLLERAEMAAMTARAPSPLSRLCLALLDRRAAPGRPWAELAPRLDAALGILEASPASAERFLGPSAAAGRSLLRNRLQGVAAILRGAAAEAALRLLRPFCTTAAQRFLCGKGAGR